MGLARNKGNNIELRGKHVDLVATEFFCTFAKIEQEVEHLKEAEAVLYPILLRSVQSMNSRFGDTGEFMDRITATTEVKSILRIERAEPTGPRRYLDVLLIVPYTGNTLAKLVNGITDTPVPMAAKTHLWSGRPLVISVFTNDALGINFENIGLLFSMKDIYFVLFGQDDPVKKLTSTAARTGPIGNTLKEALGDRQIQSVIQRV